MEEHAIIGCATVETLQDRNLDIIAPGLSSLRRWRQQQDWDSKFLKSYPSYRKASDELINAAVVLAFAFDMKEKSIMVKRFLSPELCIRSAGFDGHRVSGRIKEEESLRSWCRACEKVA